LKIFNPAIVGARHGCRGRQALPEREALASSLLTTLFGGAKGKLKSSALN